MHLLAALALLAFPTIRLRNVTGAGGVVTVGSVNDTVWVSMQVANGDIFTIRSDSQTMAAWADSPTLFNDQAIAFTQLTSDSSAYVVHGTQGTRRDSIQLSADSARAVFAAMHGATPVYATAGQAFLKFQVQRHAAVVPGTHAPEYPESERWNHRAGDVQARLVVDSRG